MNIEELNKNESYINLLKFIDYYKLTERIKRVLDVGSGIGTTIFLTLDCIYDAIDIDKEAINLLSNELNKINNNFNTYNSSFIEYSFGKKKYDLILMNHFLNRIEFNKIEINLNKAYTLLEDDGIISILVNSISNSQINIPKKLIVEKNINVDEIAPNKFTRFIENEILHYNYFELEEIEEILIKSKFQIIECIEFKTTHYKNKLSDSTINVIAIPLRN